MKWLPPLCRYIRLGRALLIIRASPASSRGRRRRPPHHRRPLLHRPRRGPHGHRRGRPPGGPARGAHGGWATGGARGALQRGGTPGWGGTAGRAPLLGWGALRPGRAPLLLQGRRWGGLLGATIVARQPPLLLLHLLGSRLGQLLLARYHRRGRGLHPEAHRVGRKLVREQFVVVGTLREEWGGKVVIEDMS